MPEEFRDLAVSRARIVLVDHGKFVLGPFSPKAHDYAAAVLEHDGVELRLGTSVEEIRPDSVVLSGGETITTRCVVWGGGLQAAEIASRSGLATGHAGRIEVVADLTVRGRPGVYAVGDIAGAAAPDGGPFPQLGSVALQQGRWAAGNIAADIAAKPRSDFRYHDKGIMAMIGRGAAVAEIGEHRHELHGPIAFSAWLGVHVALMSGVRHRVDAFVSWAGDYFTGSGGPQILDRTDAARIDWGEEPDPA
jgi:NADH:ubiquinone reductase (H+-translocating)